jgi:hypothetical protein
MVLIAKSSTDDTTVATEDDETQNSFLAEEESDGFVKIVSPMFQLILGSSWDAVIDRCQSKPREAKQWAVRGDIDSWRRLPLHEACIRQANVDVIKALLDAFPLAVKSFDHSTRLPLHHACFHGCSTDVIRVLLGAYPTGLEKKDAFGKTPLILAGSSSSKNKASIVEILMKGPEECIIEGHRSKWEKDQKQLLSTMQGEFGQEKAALELKLKSLMEESRRQAYMAEKEIGKKNSSIDELNKTIIDLNDRLQKTAKSENEMRQKNKEMEDKFARLCVSNHIDLKKKQDKIAEQSKTINELNDIAAGLKQKVDAQTEADAKVTKQITDLRVTVLEQKMNEELLQQEVSKTRAELSESLGEVLALVKKLESSIEREKDVENRLHEVSTELEKTKQSNKLLQERTDMLQEQVNMMTTTHEQAIQNSFDNQVRLELENRNCKEELYYLKNELKEKEKTITSMEEKFSSLCVTNHVTSKKQQDKIIEQAEIIITLEANIKRLNQNATDLTYKVDNKAKCTKEINELRAVVQEQKKNEEMLLLEIKKSKADAALSRREVSALIQKSAMAESQLKAVTGELNRKVNERHASDAKYTKQITELLATIQEQEKKQELLQLAIAECKAELLAHKSVLPSEREEEIENRLRAVTSELDCAKISSQLFQQRNCMLQEQISKMTMMPSSEIHSSLNNRKRLEHDEEDIEEKAIHSSFENQKRLELEEESKKEEVDCLKRTLVEQEQTIVSIEKCFCTPANLLCVEADPEPDCHPPNSAPTLDTDLKQQESSLSCSCSTPICVTNIIFN